MPKINNHLKSAAMVQILFPIYSSTSDKIKFLGYKMKFFVVAHRKEDASPEAFAPLLDDEA